MCEKGTITIAQIAGKPIRVDSCIASLVEAVNTRYATIESCCGHGQVLGTIDLEDGRRLLVEPAEGLPPWIKIKLDTKLRDRLLGKKTPSCLNTSGWRRNHNRSKHSKDKGPHPR